MEKYDLLIYETLIGPLLLRSENGVLSYCKWTTDKSISEKNIRLFKLDEIENSDILSKEKIFLESVINQIDEFFRGERKEFELPYKFEGTDFQEKVWKTISEIRYGEKISYSELADKIGNPKAVRAVANACGANPLCLFIPCHRITASGGLPGGYTGGLEKKLFLLGLEKNHK